MKAPIFAAFDGDFPTPPVPPCSKEEYDLWFRAKVQEALDDPDETWYSHEEIMAETQAIIDSQRREKELREYAESQMAANGQA